MTNRSITRSCIQRSKADRKQKECFKCKKKNHFSKLCQSSEKKPGSGVGNPKCFSRKDVHEVEKSKFEYDTDIVEFK